MDVFDHNLEAIEASSFRCCYFGGKVVTQVLVDNTIGSGEECKNMGKKVAFIVRQLGPVCNVCGKVNLLDRPEGGFGFLVHLPDVRMLDGE
jgi:hypothetical protein